MATLTRFPHGSSVSAWVMEYHPEFLARWHPRPDSSGGVRRHDILTRYREVLHEPVEDPVFEDVIGMTIAATSSVRDHFVAFCTSAGYPPEPRADGAITLRGPDVVLRFVESPSSARGIKEVEMRTRGGLSLPDRHLGRSTLHFSSGTAILMFG
jgi:hypothetical protein